MCEYSHCMIKRSKSVDCWCHAVVIESSWGSDVAYSNLKILFVCHICYSIHHYCKTNES